MEMKDRRITIVGCGPGAPECVTPEARAAVLEADVLVGAPRVLELFPEAAAARVSTRGSAEEAAAAIAAHTGRRVAVLVTGDPGVASLGRRIIERFGRAACRVIPGVSSVQVAFARLGVEWAGARILSAHGELPRLDAAALAGESRIAILGGAAGAAGWTAALAGALGAEWRLYLARNLTLPGEEVREVSPEELRRDAGAGPVLFILLRSDVL